MHPYPVAEFFEHFLKYIFFSQFVFNVLLPEINLNKPTLIVSVYTPAAMWKSLSL